MARTCYVCGGDVTQGSHAAWATVGLGVVEVCSGECHATALWNALVTAAKAYIPHLDQLDAPLKVTFETPHGTVYVSVGRADRPLVG